MQLDAVLPNLDGQSALNPAADLLRQRLLEAYGFQVIGVNSEAIEPGEDRTAVSTTIEILGIDMLRGQAVQSVEEAEQVSREIAYPSLHL